MQEFHVKQDEQVLITFYDNSLQITLTPEELRAKLSPHATSKKEEKPFSFPSKPVKVVPKKAVAPVKATAPKKAAIPAKKVVVVKRAGNRK